jgi:hypothetical protein
MGPLLGDADLVAITPNSPAIPISTSVDGPGMLTLGSVGIYPV